MTLADAHDLADSVIAKLAPTIERAMICGSVRRKKKECSDVDIVVIPRRDQVKDLFGTVTGYQTSPEFIRIVNGWDKVKGEPAGRYTVRHVHGHNVELSMCNRDNFGNIVLIRTGDADFSHLVMKRVLKMGFEQRDGYLWDGLDRKIVLAEEKDYFNILNLPFVEPENRNADAFRAV